MLGLDGAKGGGHEVIQRVRDGGEGGGEKELLPLHSQHTVRTDLLTNHLAESREPLAAVHEPP